jgi:predicted RNA-binding protein Jag
MLGTVETIAKNFFEKLTVDYSELTVLEEVENIFRISLKSDDSHLLIGPHGKNLEVITHLLKLLIAKKSEGHVNIHVEVNDYLEKKDEKLLTFIQSKIDYVKSSGKEIILPFFTAYERKKVHSYVSEKG